MKVKLVTIPKKSFLNFLWSCNCCGQQCFSPTGLLVVEASGHLNLYFDWLNGPTGLYIQLSEPQNLFFWQFLWIFFYFEKRSFLKGKLFKGLNGFLKIPFSWPHFMDPWKENSSSIMKYSVPLILIITLTLSI